MIGLDRFDVKEEICAIRIIRRNQREIIEYKKPVCF